MPVKVLFAIYHSSVGISCTVTNGIICFLSKTGIVFEYVQDTLLICGTRREIVFIALRQRHQRYQEIADAIAETMDVIEKNKGWFGNQAKIRKAAQARLLQLQEQMAREFPTGKP